MSMTPLQYAESLQIGTVDFVSPDEIRALLDIEAPDSIALNAGTPRPFPRVNGYVLMPVEEGYLVGQIEWLTVERSAFPKRRGMQDFGLVDLPYPLRKMRLNPLGILRENKPSTNEFNFRRGAETLPSVGSPVLLPTERQLRSIVESGEDRRVLIGTSPLAGNAEVSIDPDRLFGRHLAILGNTGSGKSCSVAGLIRWSLEQAKQKRNEHPNARFIILDPNGEYSRAFTAHEDPKARIFKVEPQKGSDEKLLQVPLWFWNSAEWCSFTQASAKTQRPTLIQALRSVRTGETEPTQNESHEVRRYLRTLLTALHIAKNSGAPWSGFPKSKNFLTLILNWREGIDSSLAKITGTERTTLENLILKIDAFSSARTPTPANQFVKYEFTLVEIDEFIDLMRKAHSAFGGTKQDTESIDIDVPRPFTGDALVRSVEAVAEMLNVADHTETLLLRIRSILSDVRMKPLIGDGEEISLMDWLESYMGSGETNEAPVTVIDLSLVPSEVIHTITAVISRIIFEALQRYRKLNNEVLPTVLVMEEAHTFIRRYKDDIENQDAATTCCQVFERIAREGRKFGLGLVLSSQRPSELSPTVLSQCNSFLLHRISNDRDQELVHRLVPDNLKGLLRELPSLPSQNAILLGWASELPILVKMKDLPKDHQPRSDDPDFWNVWVGKDDDGNPVKRDAGWKKITDDWQRISSKEIEVKDETASSPPALEAPIVVDPEKPV